MARWKIAKRSRGTPRIANRLLRRVRDFADVKADGDATREVADAALTMLDVDARRLDIMDRKLLLAVIEKFLGGPVVWTISPPPSARSATPSKMCWSRI